MVEGGSTGSTATIGHRHPLIEYHMTTSTTASLSHPGADVFLANSQAIMGQLEETGTALASFIESCALNSDQKANLSEVVRSISAQRMAIRISVEDPHTEVSESDKLDLLARASRSIEGAQAFLQSPE